MEDAAPVAAPRKPPRRAAAKPALAIVPNDPAEVLRRNIDELGRLEADVIEIRPKLRRIETLRELIRGRYAGEQPSSAFETRGADYLATLGPCALQATIDYAAVEKIMGVKAYAAISRPSLKTLEETLAPDVLATVVSHEYKGARPLKTFPLGTVAPRVR